MPSPRLPLQVLNEVFGHTGFRGNQAAIINRVTAGGDALVLMPTGGGKSLCYQIPALARPGTGIVISPLIALMQDQVAALRGAGVRAAFLNSSLEADERRAVMADYAARRLDVLYLSPERLAATGTLEFLARAPISVIAIDEAHCVASWGHDFRPDYLTISRLTEQFPDVPRIALTATATPATADEIAQRLGLRLGEGEAGTEPGRFVASFDRPNIEYRIVPKNNPREQLLEFLRADHAGHSGIVYCLTRRSVEETASFLNANGIAAVAYHAGMSPEVRAAHYDRFMAEDDLVVVATIAFGMGIDKASVRFVAHLDLPKSIEGYYQETGRAGRDGAPATAWLAYGLADVAQLKRFIARSPGGVGQRRFQTANLDAMLALCESVQCRRTELLTYFGEPGSADCGRCDTCLTPPSSYDVTAPARHVLTTVLDALTDRRPLTVDALIDELTSGTTSDGTGWHRVLRHLIARGYLTCDVRGRQTLALSRTAALLLDEEEELRVRSEQPVESAAPARARRTKRGRKARTKRTSGTKTARVVVDVETLSPADRRRLEALQRWRDSQAKRHGVKPNGIFNDQIIAAMAQANPSTPAELLAVPGIGPQKLKRWGNPALEVLAEA